MSISWQCRFIESNRTLVLSTVVTWDARSVLASEPPNFDEQAGNGRRKLTDNTRVKGPVHYLSRFEATDSSPEIASRALS
jgi:hypothetical protein